MPFLATRAPTICCRDVACVGERELSAPSPRWRRFLTICALFGAVTRSLSGRYEWAKDGFGDLLMMALPHHVDTMGGVNGEDAAFLMKDSYQSIKVREGRGSRSTSW